MGKSNPILRLYSKEHLIEEGMFRQFYDLLSSSLPKEEYRDYEGQKELLSNQNYKLFLLEEHGFVNALITTWEFDDLRFVEHFAVSERMRGNGIGGKILTSYLEKDERMVVLEVELPKKEDAVRRIKFYERCGLHLNQYPYQQYPLNEGDAPLSLYLMTYPNPLTDSEFHRLKTILYRQVYGAKDI